ncbi:GGDEF domain-containing protein [Rhodococcus sp. G-MC3]|uniref:GGDEF domain-containing protein n=1 Tax=Rhodococcus sp. G-MC3 TaxID=3046209 RepID=UPI0024B94BE1|nr:GGDEF domain-containing protein [Rhodococcus sp. G-MC3]MDJ0396380.1 GGDEF domain-containing protein [Rhodococcus sp. G-MC3]
MRQFSRWWNHPADYDWTVAYHRRDPLLRYMHVALWSWCWLYAVLALLAAHTPAGTPDGVGRVIAYALAATAAAIGLVWLRGPWPSRLLSRVFVAYLEIGAVVLLLLLHDPFVALPCSAALGVIGRYIVTFHSPRMFVAHQGLSVTAVGVLFFGAVTAPDADVVLACAYLVVLTLVLFSAPILANFVLLLLRRDAASASYDPLTGLLNRRGFDVAIAERLRGPATVMVIDLDDFKLVNDEFGHSHGDVVLREVADALHSVFGPPAFTARTGGEEFVVLDQGTAAEAIERAHRLRLRFHDRESGGTTVSIGVAHIGADASIGEFRRACDRADAAMYTAKQAGGDSIHVDDMHENLGEGQS